MDSTLQQHNPQDKQQDYKVGIQQEHHMEILHMKGK
jgi:hypothetical protein